MSVYQRAHVTVDENFARFGSKSYAINKITSVDVKDNSRESSAWLIFAILAALTVVAAIGSAAEKDSAAVGMFIFAFILAIPAYFMFKNRRTESYVLMLATAAGEVQATQSANRESILELRQVLERRIARLPE